MLSIKECRKLIPKAEELTDEQVEEIRKGCYGIAELAWDVWLVEKRYDKLSEK